MALASASEKLLELLVQSEAHGDGVSPHGFMVRSEGAFIWCDFMSYGERRRVFVHFVPKSAFGRTPEEERRPILGQVSPPLITVWLQVRVLPGPPRTSISCSLFVALSARTAPDTFAFVREAIAPDFRGCDLLAASAMSAKCSISEVDFRVSVVR